MPERELQVGRMQAVGGLLRHDDPSQLLFQLAEIVGEEVYLRHGVTVGKDDVVLDVGANVGVAAAFFASGCGAGLVHSFEPVAPVFRLLDENLRQFPACVAHNYGLSATPRRAEITYYPRADSMSGLHADPSADRDYVRTYMINAGLSPADADRELGGRYEAVALTCQLRTLSSVLEEERLEHVDLLKVDVEKAELEVLAGIEERDWPRIKQVVLEVHDEHGRAAAIEQMLTRRGFAVTIERDPRWRNTPMCMLYAARNPTG